MGGARLRRAEPERQAGAATDRAAAGVIVAGAPDRPDRKDQARAESGASGQRQSGADRAQPAQDERHAHAVALALAGLLPQRAQDQSITRDHLSAASDVLAQALLHVG